MKKKILNSYGILLVEILLIMTVLTFSLTLIIQSLTVSYRALYFTKDYSLAQLLLENKMLDLMKNKDLSLNYQEEGAFDYPFDKYRFRINTQEKLIGARDVLNEATLSVAWESGKGSQEVKVSTYFFIPDEEKNDE